CRSVPGGGASGGGLRDHEGDHRPGPVSPGGLAADEERREVAGVPEEIGFATKPQQALSMVTGALATGIEARWFAGDEVYCGRELRRGIRSLGPGYTVGIAATYQVTDGGGRRWEARKLINKVRPEQWMRRQTGHGTKGTREYDWAWLDVRPDDTPDENENENETAAGAGTSVPVARRHRYTGEVSYFRCWAPGDVALATLIEVISRRWRIEETFQLAKGFRARPGSGDLLELLDALVTVLPVRGRSHP
ncbi:transposase, partial [Streptomyces sp. NPDC126514]|uniref:transposase n=1 Tax=Streptomyces sp. NPDC126514 TaxID=3155210 RepID=UPI00332328AF